MLRALGALLLLGLVGEARAQAVVTSPAAESVSVTVYRDPDRGPDDELDLASLEGFALVTETRRIALPAGASTIRFEGVAGGIVPVSAIVSGLPGGVVEKNREAALLSPAALVDGSLGRRVHLRRTSRATGQVVEQDATILAGPDGGVVLRTRDGVEALRCSGLPERLSYPNVPTGLSARPTLTVTTTSDRAFTATVTLSYLADAFDWSANYVAQVAPGGDTLELFAWLTLANGNDESFAEARTQVVAGRLNRAAANDDRRYTPLALAIRCWPQGTTSTALPPPPGPPPPPPSPMAEYASEDIVVTGARRALVSAAPVMVAQQEELGDLKLYRVPEPVTVAANAQKQVAFLTKSRVPFEQLYGAEVDLVGEVEEPEPAKLLLRMRNRTERGLGVPLPGGNVAVFRTDAARPMLVGEASIADRAVGEEVELMLGESPQVQLMQRLARPDAEGEEDDAKPRGYVVELTNANARPVTVEVILQRYDARVTLVDASRKLGTKDGRILWTARVPANGTAELRYTVRCEREADE